MSITSLLSRIDQQKTKLNALRPFEEPLLRELQAFYRVGLVYSSNALEGFSYTLSETKVLIEDGLTAGGRPLRDALAVTGHAQAYDHMFTLMRKDTIIEADILVFHKFLAGSLEAEWPSGHYRKQPVFISGSKYPVTAHQEVPAAMNQILTWYEQAKTELHPVLLAATLHKKLVFVHPFVDGNGRVARLVMNTILIQHGYMPAYIPPVLRSEYIASLEQARHNDGLFLELICQCEYEAQKEILRMIQGERAEKL